MSEADLSVCSTCLKQRKRESTRSNFTLCEVAVLIFVVVVGVVVVVVVVVVVGVR